jgi:hypothetical protein
MVISKFHQHLSLVLLLFLDQIKIYKNKKYMIFIATFNEFLNENILIDITKNTEPAPYLDSRFGQDVEPKGTYVLQGKIDNEGYINGKANLKNPLFVNVTDDTLIEYKRELANKYKAKGQKLTNKLMRLGYDSIITVKEDGEYGEIVLFPNAHFILY